MIATLLSASVGVPYVVSHQTGGKADSAAPGAATATATNSLSSPWPGTTSSAAPQLATQTPFPGAQAHLVAVHPVQTSGSSPMTSLAPGTGTSTPAPMHPVEQVLRFDLTREWVYQNWDRKSTGPTDVGLFAVRVALVSGTDLNSLAGSLTYFFNQYGQIEHISFRGRTGDTTKLVAFLTRTYLFEAVPAPTGELLYQVKRSGKVQSEFRARPEPVLRSTSPHSNITVDLELARPGTNRFLPPRGPALQVPPAASTPTPAATTAGGATTSGENSSLTDSVQSIYDKARYATPQEQGQVLWKRWPN